MESVGWGHVGEEEVEAVGGEPDERHVGEDSHDSELVQYGGPHPYVGGTVVAGTACVLNELHGVDPYLDDVVEESKERGEGEGGGEERDVSELHHHLVVVVEHTGVLLHGGFHLPAGGFLHLVALRQLAGELLFLHSHLPTVFEPWDGHFQRLLHHYLRRKHRAQGHGEHGHAAVVWAGHVHAVDGHVVLDEGDEEEGEVGVDELEEEVLGDKGVLKLGLGAPVFNLCQLVHDQRVNGVENHNRYGVGNAADGATDLRPPLLHRLVLEGHDPTNNVHDRHDEDRDDRGRDGHAPPPPTVWVVRLSLARDGVGSRFCLLVFLSLFFLFLEVLRVPLKLLPHLQPLPALQVEHRPQSRECTVKGNPGVVQTVCVGVGVQLSSGQDDPHHGRDPQRLRVEPNPGEIKCDLLPKVLADLL
mmetsp:Transcript_65336/g.142490  ORF Transcript_65336/g.142490 Transcript_65336/m.142490 type:complete len:416 (+) Transcript_65336:299-1546(+)